MVWVNVINDILSDIKGWAFAILAGVAVVRVVISGVQYQGASEMERNEIVGSMKRSLSMIAIIFFVVWLISYIFNKLSNAGIV